MVSMIDGTTSALLGLALDAAGMRQQAIAHNIANANTPGYRPVAVDFERYMAQAGDALARGERIALSDLSDYRPRFVPADEGAQGGQPVALDLEVAKLSANTLHHQALLKALNRHFSMIGMAIGEGKH